jgi:hypothetical protein
MLQSKQQLRQMFRDITTAKKKKKATTATTLYGSTDTSTIARSAPMFFTR